MWMEQWDEIVRQHRLKKIVEQLSHLHKQTRSLSHKQCISGKLLFEDVIVLTKNYIYDAVTLMRAERFPSFSGRRYHLP